MINNFAMNMSTFWQDVLQYLNELYQYPIKLISLILDVAIVTYLIIKVIQLAKSSRTMQLIKGIFVFIIIMWASELLHLRILYSIVSAFLPSGVVALVVIFQPEIRRALEQIGTNKVSKFFGMSKDIETKTKEDIYKIVIAAEEMSKSKTGALIVIERDIKIDDIVSTGIDINSDISPQLLVNIFVPNTPLHDGAVIIANNKIISAACILPLAGSSDVSRELGTRHRAAVGISKESDAIAVVVSEESGKVSVAKNGTLIVDVTEEALKQILIKNIVLNRLENTSKKKKNRLENIRAIRKNKKVEEISKESKNIEEQKKEE